MSSDLNGRSGSPYVIHAVSEDSQAKTYIAQLFQKGEALDCINQGININLLIISNYAPIRWINEKAQHIIPHEKLIPVLLSSKIPTQSSNSLGNVQWVDFRRFSKIQFIEQLRAGSDLQSKAVSHPPESLEKHIYPSAIVAISSWLIMLGTFGIIWGCVFTLASLVFLNGFPHSWLAILGGVLALVLSVLTKKRSVSYPLHFALFLIVIFALLIPLWTYVESSLSFERWESTNPVPVVVLVSSIINLATTAQIRAWFPRLSLMRQIAAAGKTFNKEAIFQIPNSQTRYSLLGAILLPVVLLFAPLQIGVDLGIRSTLKLLVYSLMDSMVVIQSNDFTLELTPDWVTDYVCDTPSVIIQREFDRLKAIGRPHFCAWTTGVRPGSNGIQLVIFSLDVTPQFVTSTYLEPCKYIFHYPALEFNPCEYFVDGNGWYVPEGEATQQSGRQYIGNIAVSNSIADADVYGIALADTISGLEEDRFLRDIWQEWYMFVDTLTITEHDFLIYIRVPEFEVEDRRVELMYLVESFRLR